MRRWRLANRLAQQCRRTQSTAALQQPLLSRPSSVNEIQALSSRSGSAAQANAVFQTLKNNDQPLDRATAHALLRALAVHPDAVLRSEILDEMQHRWIPISDAGWHDIIVGYTKEMQIEQALDALHSLRDRNVYIQPWLYDMLTYMLCDLKEVEEALELTKIRIRAGHEFEIEGPVWYYIFDAACTLLDYRSIEFIWRRRVNQKYMNPSDGQCLAVLHAAAQAADVQLATDVFQVLSNRSSTFESQHYELLMEAYLQHRDVKTALTIMCIMNGAGIRPTTRATRLFQKYLIDDAFAQAQVVKEAANSPSSKQDPSASAAAEDFISAPVRAFSILEALKEKENRQVPIAAFNAVLVATLETEGLAIGIEQYKQCHRIVGRPDSTTFNELLKACRMHARDIPGPLIPAHSQEIDRWNINHKDTAMFLAAEMVALGVKPTALTYDRCILVCLESCSQLPSRGATANQLAEAREDFEDALKYLAEMQAADMTPRRGTFDHLIRAACLLGDDRALVLAEDVRNAGYDDTVSRGYLEKFRKDTS